MSQSGCSTFTPTWSFIQSTTRVRTPPEHTREHWNISQINTLICMQWITSMSKVPQWTITCICIVNKNYWTNFNLFTADLCKRLFSWHLFVYTCAYQLRYWPCNLKITSNVVFFILMNLQVSYLVQHVHAHSTIGHWPWPQLLWPQNQSQPLYMYMYPFKLTMQPYLATTSLSCILVSDLDPCGLIII